MRGTPPLLRRTLYGGWVPPSPNTIRSVGTPLPERYTDPPGGPMGAQGALLPEMSKNDRKWPQGPETRVRPSFIDGFRDPEAPFRLILLKWSINRKMSRNDV